MIKAIIFDAYGVLLTDALVPVIDELRAADEASAKKVYELLQSTCRGRISHGDFVEQAALILRMEPSQLHAMVDVGEVQNGPLLTYIKTLRTKYKIGVLSNISPGVFHRRFPEADARKYFDVVIQSGDIGYIKPEAEAYLTAAERLGVAPDECVMVDDRQICVDGAKAVGMQAVLYSSTAQLKTDLAGVLT